MFNHLKGNIYATQDVTFDSVFNLREGMEANKSKKTGMECFHTYRNLLNTFQESEDFLEQKKCVFPLLLHSQICMENLRVP